MSVTVYDCFLFFNELDLLEIRLNILADVVDKFVLVEADRTFSNKEKPFYFEDNKNRFAKFLNKIIHIKVKEYPETKDAWDMESYQRNQIANGLTGCLPDDIILISDLDEIPNPKIINVYKKNGKGICRIKQLHFDYFLNYKRLDQNWDCAKILRYNDILSPSPSKKNIQDIRSREGSKKLKLIKNGGWHFSFLGGIENIRKKVQSFSHQEYNNEHYINDSITYKINRGLDIFDRKHIRLIPIKISKKHYPNYIVTNQDTYYDLIFTDISKKIVIINSLYYVPFFIKSKISAFIKLFLPKKLVKYIENRTYKRRKQKILQKTQTWNNN